MHCFIFLKSFVVWSCVKHVYLVLVSKHSQICGVQITGKCILQVKKWKVDILTLEQNSPRVLIITGKTLPQVLITITPKGRGKLLTPTPDAASFWRSVPPLNRKWEGEEAMKVLLVLHMYISFVAIKLKNHRSHS